MDVTRKTFKHLSVLLAVFVLSAEIAEAKQCKNLFFHDPFKGQVISDNLNKLFLKSTEKMAMSTTGARIEKKWTVNTNKLSENLIQFKNQIHLLDLELKLRDQKKDGYENITETIYLEKIQVKSPLTNEPLSLKMRIRKYGFTLKNSNDYKVEYADFTKNHSFLEFKLPDARFTGAVFKPRIYLPDQIIQMIGKPEFITKQDEILNTALQLNVNKYADESTVKAMLNALKVAQIEQTQFTKVAQNMYIRDSYSITFYDQKSNRHFDVQMTLDQNIKMNLLTENKIIQAYKPTDSVIEIKIPTEYSSLTIGQDLSSIKGYKQFLEFVSLIEKNHDVHYEAGRGKNFHAHRSYVNDLISP